ncbi:hypothetical protein GF402_01610 [Candidatus Fermentibacteria bacterium]|nr:hypothetical protein [Candidatus Fermentibacteria bacterium]
MQMKIALTADVHLSEKGEHPERLSGLRNVLQDAKSQGSELCVVCGDLFDGQTRSCSHLDELMSSPELGGIDLVVLRGNHDSRLRSADVVSDNVRIVTETVLERPDPQGLPILMVSYDSGSNMGDEMARFQSSLGPDGWILLGHGDFLGGTREPNPYEPGTYMPLTAMDIRRFRPRTVVLGHIHRPHESGGVWYPGSPCGLDVTETGTRRYLLLDARSGRLESRPVDSDVLYFVEDFLVVPGPEEESRLRRQVKERIDSWNLPEGEEEKVRVRVMANGYSSDKSRLREVLVEEFGRFRFHDPDGPDLSRVSGGGEERLDEIARMAIERLDSTELRLGPDDTDLDRIRRKILEVVYGETE